MPAKAPAYQLHKASGQAKVRIDGKDHYLGVYDSPSSREAYDAIVTKWLRREQYSSVLLTVDELALLYLDFATGYYVKNGRPTSEVHEIRASIRPLVARCGRLRVGDFSPLKLKAVREDMVSQGWCRNTVNARVKRLRRLFKWGVENEYVPAQVLTGLTAVAALKYGKTTAKERPRVKPADESIVDATLPFLPGVVADMVRLQLVTGMRPAEVCQIRPGDVDRSESTWTYSPASHKTEHHGRERVIFIGPKRQAVLAPYLLRAAESYCFAPSEAEQERRTVRHEARKTPLHYGNRPGTNRTEEPLRSPGEAYTTASYARAITRGCDKAFPIPEEIASDPQTVAGWRTSHRWSPNRIRHTFATSVRKQFGLEAAQVLLGHAGANITQIYAERDADKARAVAGVVG